mmetsp:Transcript_28507/g.77179  ORF Transcript_28507/g.77179 Transcript_28507/m.77179 type:complete len:265 (-) Transcript_28507:41-835(-)
MNSSTGKKNTASAALIKPLVRCLFFHAIFCFRRSQSFQPVALLNNNVDVWVQPTLWTRTFVQQRGSFIATGIGMASSKSETDTVSIPFDGSEDRFDRWRWLQEFLDGDHPSSDVVNIVLYRVLEGALKYPRPAGGGDTLGSGDTEELTTEMKERIGKFLSDYSTEGRVKAVVTMSINDDGYEEEEQLALAILKQIEGVLPDPIEDEDDHKSLWDTVIEIHGREAVKINETRNPVSMDWKIASTVTRVLLHFDFLTLGIVNAPLI